jgi:hypothetical protein
VTDATGYRRPDRQIGHGHPAVRQLTKTKCGSRRASARPRLRWVRHYQCRLCRRHRSLAKARQLPQGAYSAFSPRSCGRCNSVQAGTLQFGD